MTILKLLGQIELDCRNNVILWFFMGMTLCTAMLGGHSLVTGNHIDFIISIVGGVMFFNITLRCFDEKKVGLR